MVQLRFARALTALAGLAIGSTALAGPFPITVAALEGDNVAGVGDITLINNVAINNFGEWLVEIDTNNPNLDVDAALLKNGVLYSREGDPIDPFGGITLSSYDSVQLNNNSDFSGNIFLDGATTTTDSGIYFNDKLVIRESNVSTAPQFNAGTIYTGWFGVYLNDNSQMMMVSSVDDPIIPSTTDRALVRVDYNPGPGTFTETVHAKEGDTLGRMDGETVADFSTGEHSTAFNNNGDVLFLADFTGDTTRDGMLFMNNTLLAQEGEPSPIGGRNYETILSRAVDLNDNGDWVLQANLTGDTTNDEVIVKNGTIFKQEGDVAPNVPGGFLLTSFGLSSGPVEIANTGDVLWYGDWDDPNTDIDTGLFLNDMLLVQEGVTMINGMIVDTIANGQDAFHISDNGEWILFEADLVGGISGAFVIRIPAPGSAALLACAGGMLVRRRRG